MSRMAWEKLLNRSRIRQLLSGGVPPEPSHRSEFQKDFDRLVFSSPLRRLQDKAQVFPLEPNDAVRTRLTHSLEVSTVARGITLRVAERLKDIDPDFEQYATDVQTIAATAGLIHDLGNPPFGHFGEDAIREWFASCEFPGNHALKSLDGHPQLVADFRQFEGNAQTIRLLCSLQILADRFGMNLTASSLGAVMKYVARSDEATKSHEDHAKSKPGFFWAEEDVVNEVWQATGTAGVRHPIAFIVEAADDCVYALSDLEDGVKKGVVSWKGLRESLEESHVDEPSAQTFINELCEQTEAKIKEQLETSALKLEKRASNDAHAQMFRVLAAHHVVNGAAQSFAQNYDAIMNGSFRGELVTDEVNAQEARWIIQAYKRVGPAKVYSTRENLELELRGRHVIHDLMNLLWLGIKDYDGNPPKTKDLRGKAWNLLSLNYRTVFQNDFEQIPQKAKEKELSEAALKQYYRLLLLTDYISGMTDTFACTLHRSLNNG